MKNLLNLAAIAAIGMSLGACQVKTQLPFATAKVGPSSSSPSEFAESSGGEGGFDEPSDCEQEFGRDAGGQARSAHTIGQKRVYGCLVQGDRRDVFLVKVRDDVDALVYRFKIISINKTIGAKIYTMDGEELAGDGVINDGQAFRKNIQLEGGETYQIVINNFHNHDNVSYSVLAKPTEIVAEN